MMNSHRNRIAGRTTRSAREDEPVVCSCGSAWFGLRGASETSEIGAVTVAPSGRITGYSGELVCIECGNEVDPAKARGPELRIVE